MSQEEKTFFGCADRRGGEAGRAELAVADLTRQVGISEQRFYRWKKAYTAWNRTRRASSGNWPMRTPGLRSWAPS